MASSQPSAAVPWLLALSVAASGAAAILVVTSRPLLGGLAAAAAVGASILAGLGAGRSEEARLVFADHAVERVLEAALFGSVAWAAAPEEPWTAGAALAALVLSYVASYMSAKAIGLGFELHERVPYRSVRPLLAVVGLLFVEILDVALWAAAAISLEPVIRHGTTVARQREPA